MLTIPEIEAACDTGCELDFSRHAIEPAELHLKATYYPFGFPAEVRTNCAEVLEVMGGLWGRFQRRYDTRPIRSEVFVVDGESDECPPEPIYRLNRPLLLAVADGNNYSIVDVERDCTQITISHAALRHRLYAEYFLLSSPVVLIATRRATPIHAACVEWNGHGILLCGDSGMGKSTLSYACARAGWTYISDDATFLLQNRGDRMVTGDCHRVRFRPTAAELFPEIRGREITPRAAGKPSIELPTSSLPNITPSQTTRIDSIVFLNRFSNAEPQLKPYRKDVARHFMRQVIFGVEETMAVQCSDIERLLEAKIFELHYSGLDWAIERLRQLAEEGN